MSERRYHVSDTFGVKQIELRLRMQCHYDPGLRGTLLSIDLRQEVGEWRECVIMRPPDLEPALDALHVADLRRVLFGRALFTLMHDLLERITDDDLRALGWFDAENDATERLSADALMMIVRRLVDRDMPRPG